jgi:hypothetical protein
MVLLLWALLLAAVAFTSNVAHAAHNVTLDDSDPRIQYSIGWVAINDSRYLGGTTHGTSTPGATAQLDFTGVHSLTFPSPSVLSKEQGRPSTTLATGMLIMDTWESHSTVLKLWSTLMLLPAYFKSWSSLRPGCQTPATDLSFARLNPAYLWSLLTNLCASGSGFVFLD